MEYVKDNDPPREGEMAALLDRAAREKGTNRFTRREVHLMRLAVAALEDRDARAALEVMERGAAIGVLRNLLDHDDRNVRGNVAEAICKHAKAPTVARETEK